jgi:hypothetical protein
MLDWVGVFDTPTWLSGCAQNAAVPMRPRVQDWSTCFGHWPVFLRLRCIKETTIYRFALTPCSRCVFFDATPAEAAAADTQVPAAIDSGLRRAEVAECEAGQVGAVGPYLGAASAVATGRRFNFPDSS